VALRFHTEVLTPDDYLFDIGYTSEGVIEVTAGNRQITPGRPKPNFRATADELARTVADVMTRRKIEDGSDLFCAGRVLPPRLTLRQCGVIAGDTLPWRRPNTPQFTHSQESVFWEAMTCRTFEVACPLLVNYNYDTLSIAGTKGIVADKFKWPVHTISLMFKPGNRHDPNIVPWDTELIRSYVTWNVFQPSGSFVALLLMTTRFWTMQRLKSFGRSWGGA
jgi:hypothetical protein